MSADCHFVCNSPVTEAHTQVAAKSIIGLNDARFDQHLRHRNIDPLQQATHVFESRGRVLHKNLIGARIDCDTASLRKQALFFVAQQLSHILRLLIIDNEGLGAQRLQIGDLIARLELKLFLGGNLVTRRDQHHVAVLAHVQALALQNDVERLVPRDVL